MQRTDASNIRTRFLAKVQKTRKCWIWKSMRRLAGYGYMKINDRRVPAHRVSYEIFVGPIPKGMMVCHKCDNPPCVNPDHLFLGTGKDNFEDMRKKGRYVRPKRKLAVSDYPLVKDLLEFGFSQDEIAKHFKVSQVTISRAVGDRKPGT